MYALQTVMCTESMPVLACVIPAFESLLATWMRMRDDPAKLHLKKMLNAGINKMTSQYNRIRFAKLSIIALLDYLRTTADTLLHLKFFIQLFALNGLKIIGPHSMLSTLEI